MRRMSVGALVAAAVLIGTPHAASAQVDLTGIWAPLFHEDQVERVPGPEVGDYTGLPITDAERLRADTWDASLLTLPEHQCKPHPSTYGFRGVGNLRMTPVYNDNTQQMIKLITHIQWQAGGFGDNKPITVRALAYVMAGHVRHHLAILRERYGVS